MHTAALTALLALQWAGSPPPSGVPLGARGATAFAPRAAGVRADAATGLGLTPELEKTVATFKMVPDQKLRYQQLLFLAQQAKPMADSLKVPENKVPGCLSTVFVHARDVGEGKIAFDGDSDAMLTKGLVVLLTNGLSGHTAEEICAVDPRFIAEAGIAQSLTPGRNNGLLNMLQLMKQKAQELAADGGSGAGGASGASDAEAAGAGGADAAAPTESAPEVIVQGGGPVADSIIGKITAKLKPTRVSLVDNSAQHAGHKEREGLSADGETHFALEVESPVFAGLSKVQRHQLVYALLREELDASVHALQISARVPGEP